MMFFQQELIIHKKKITEEKIIGISCGSTAVLFFVAGLSYLVYGKTHAPKRYDDILDNDDFSDDYSDTINTNVCNETNHIKSIVINNSIIYEVEENSELKKN